MEGIDENEGIIMRTKRWFKVKGNKLYNLERKYVGFAVFVYTYKKCDKIYHIPIVHGYNGKIKKISKWKFWSKRCYRDYEFLDYGLASTNYNKVHDDALELHKDYKNLCKSNNDFKDFGCHRCLKMCKESIIDKSEDILIKAKAGLE